MVFQGAQSLVEDFRTAVRRNLCRVLKGFMVISQGRRMVSSIPDRKQQGQRHRSKKLVVMCIVLLEYWKGKASSR